MVENTKNQEARSHLATKCYIRTFGCQMNEYDSELIESVLTQEGFKMTSTPDEADVILLNTCSVREGAVRRVFEQVYKLRHDLNGKDVKFGILGCVATHLKQELLDDKQLNLNFIVGPDHYRQLPDIIKNALKGRKSFETGFLNDEHYEGLMPSRKQKPNAWTAIMRGCDNFCAFCIVPYTRGRERSRSLDSIIKEVQELAGQGYSQVTLLGQNVNSYKDNDTYFAGLLEEISKIDTIRRIRFTAPHPKDFSDSLIETIARNPKICKHVHLPLQAGNDRVLKLMNRGYTKQDYLTLAGKMKAAIPDLALSTDIIVGFPTETDAEFEDTVDVMQTARFFASFIFKYSERKGTIASRKYPDDIPEDVKTARIVKLNAIQKQLSLENNTGLVGRSLDVLIENEGEQDGQRVVYGRTDNNVVVRMPSNSAKTGDYLKAQVQSASPHFLKAVQA